MHQEPLTLQLGPQQSLCCRQQICSCYAAAHFVVSPALRDQALNVVCPAQQSSIVQPEYVCTGKKELSLAGAISRAFLHCNFLVRLWAKHMATFSCHYRRLCHL